MHNQSNMLMRCCAKCKTSSREDFKQVANLKNSGLTIYVHEDKAMPSKLGNDNNKNIILYNTGNKELKRFDYISELCRYKTKCIKCTLLIQRVQDLLRDISIISKHQILGICEYCKRPNKRNKCSRCEYVVNKFVSNKVQQYKEREEQYRTLMNKVQNLLQSIIQGQVICKHNVCLDTESKMQLDTLLKCLNSPVTLKTPNIGEVSSAIAPDIDINETNQFLNDFIFKLDSNEFEDSTGESSDSSLFDSESICLCKYLHDRKIVIDKSTPFLKTFSNEKILSKIENENEKTEEQKAKKIDASFKGDMTPKTTKKSLELSKQADKKVSAAKTKYKENINKNSIAKSVKSKKKSSLSEEGNELKGKNKIHDSNYMLMAKMMKEREKEKRKEQKLLKTEKIKDIPIIADLPIIKVKKIPKIYTEQTESFIECIDKNEAHINKMIKGNRLVPYDDHIIVDNIKLPLLYKVQVDFPDLKIDEVKSTKESQESNQSKKSKSKKESSSLPIYPGVLSYTLSNREFIEKGWTELPTINMMRKVNIYKMLPSHSEFDWFKSHKKQKTLFYDGGELLAEIFENGCGKWFYRNGEIALDYNNTTDNRRNKRYIVYSCSEDVMTNKKKAVTVLACFDYRGNGIIYDHYGNVRLKYNQFEGMVMDKKVGPPSHWKWHTLNEPPVIQQVFVDTVVDDPQLKKLIKSDEKIKEPNEDMIAIELENFVNEKATKMSQKFRPFEIRIKVLKMNDNFSLRIINQSNIYLIFRCGRICLKQNIGMILKSNEIIDTEVVDLADVSTPYDNVPPKTRSLEKIQGILTKTRQLNNC